MILGLRRGPFLLPYTTVNICSHHRLTRSFIRYSPNDNGRRRGGVFFTGNEGAYNEKCGIEEEVFFHRLVF